LLVVVPQGFHRDCAPSVSRRSVAVY
jgi:hypothetical protein